MSGYLVDIFSNKNEDEATKKAFKYYTAFDYVNSILSVVSGIYLGFSIYQIRKLNKEKETELNTTQMVLHVATFAISILV